MRFTSIASGSSGNCIYVGTDATHLLVDVGISGKKTESGLNSIGKTLNMMDGILITHEHSDHICGLGVLSRKYHIPVYATTKTIEAIKSSSSLGKIDSDSPLWQVCPLEGRAAKSPHKRLPSGESMILQGPLL